MKPGRAGHSPSWGAPRGGAAARRRGAAGGLVLAFAGLARERFPGLPLGEEARLARYACARHTERVGQLTGGDGYLAEAVDLAVVAHARHRFTRYETLLAEGCPRDEARERVREELSSVLRAWSAR